MTPFPVPCVLLLEALMHAHTSYEITTTDGMCRDIVVRAGVPAEAVPQLREALAGGGHLLLNGSGYCDVDAAAWVDGNPYCLRCVTWALDPARRTVGRPRRTW